MIDPRFGTGVERKRLTDAVNRLLFEFPLAGMTIHGRSVNVRIDPRTKIPGYAGVGGFCISADALRPHDPADDTTWSEAALSFLVLHEWMHVFGNHIQRRGARDAKTWNCATDYRINADCIRILRWEGPPPNKGLVPPSWIGDMSAEDIYDQLTSNASSSSPKPKEELEQGDWAAGQDLVDENLVDAEFDSEEEFLDVFTTELAQSQVILQTLGKDISEFGPSIAERLVKLKKGKINWGRLLVGDVIGALGTTMWTYSPPNRRVYPRLIMPSWKAANERRLAIVIDISGSIQGDLLNVFAREIEPAARRAKETHVITFDAVIREHFVTKNPREAIQNLKFTTGAHSMTDARPVFTLLDTIRPSAAVVFTDGLIALPEKTYPKTQWVIPTNGRRLPWGKHYVMEQSW